MNKRLLINLSLIAASFLVSGFLAYRIWKQEIGPRVYMFKKWQQEVVITSLRNNLSSQGFTKISSDSPEIKREIFTFAGHVYPQNGFSGGPTYPGAKLMMTFYKEYIHKSRSQSAIFGGDTVYEINPSSLEFLRKLKDSLPKPYLIQGNHEAGMPPEIKAELFTKDAESVIVDNVRLVFLNSQNAQGEWLLTEEQLSFMKSLSLENKLPVFVFLHHALWADQFDGTNFEGAIKAKEQWHSVVLPILKKLGVSAVFAGDAGTRQLANFKNMNGITHVITGWPMENVHVPYQWMSLYSLKNKLIVREHAVLANYEHYYLDHFLP